MGESVPRLVSETFENGGNTFDIIPDKVTLAGTLMNISYAVDDLIHARMETIAEEVGNAHGVKARLTPRDVRPPSTMRIGHDVQRMPPLQSRAMRMLIYTSP